MTIGYRIAKDFMTRFADELAELDSKSLLSLPKNEDSLFERAIGFERDLNNDEVSHDTAGFPYSWGWLENLPVEFFNHELLAVDIDNEAAVFEFVTLWGFPYSPKRFGELATLQAYSDTRAIEKTNELVSRLGTDYYCISRDEVVESLTMLQTCVRGLFSIIKGETEWFDFQPINQAATNTHYIQSNGTYVLAQQSLTATTSSGGQLTQAICNQIIDAIEDSADWRDCKNEKCSRVFKRQRSFGSSKQPKYGPVSDSEYCSDRCREAQKSRERRRRAKERRAAE
jgi:hypothetical protein